MVKSKNTLKKIRNLGCRLHPCALKSRPRAPKGIPFGRQYVSRTASVRVCPDEVVGSRDAPPLSGFSGIGAFKCGMCLRGFRKEASYQEHVTNCTTVKDPLPKNTQRKICLWLRKGTKDENAFKEVFVSRDYEVRRAFFRLEDARTWLDLGGHVGTFTCLALRRNCDVITFEPSSESSALLKHNVQTLPSDMNNRTCWLHRAAVASAAFRQKDADKHGTMELLRSTREDETYRSTLMREKNGQVLCSADLCCGKCGLHFKSRKLCEKHEAKCTGDKDFVCEKCSRCFKTSGGRDKHQAECTGPRSIAYDYTPSERVPVFTLPEVLRSYPQIDGVKIDIEGCELEMLEDMKPADWGNVKRLVLEYSNEYDDSADRLHKIMGNLKRHFVGGVICTAFCSNGRIALPTAFNMMVYASTEPLKALGRGVAYL